MSSPTDSTWLWRIVSHFADTASMHGVGRINHSRSNLHRSLWIILLIIAIGLLFRQIYGVALKYYWHPVTTELAVDYNTPLEFPSVSICNLNPIHVRMVKDRRLLHPRRRFARQSDFVLTPDGETELVPSEEIRELESLYNTEEPTSSTKEILPTTVRPKSFLTETEWGGEMMMGPETTTTPPKSTTATKEEDEEGQEFMTFGGRDIVQPKSTTTEYYDEEAGPPFLLYGQTMAPETEGYEERQPSKNSNFTRDDDEKEAEELLENIIEGEDHITEVNSTAEKDFLRKQRLMFAINNVSPAARELLTYSIEDILVECSFLGKKCTVEDFAVIKNAHYGNCFVFNGGMNLQRDPQPLRELYVSGSEQSLSLTLFVDQQSYLPKYSPVAGYKVVIHSADQVAIPDEEGYLVKPGQFTAFASKLKVVERAKEPYGRCREFTREDNRSMNMFLDQLPMTSPDVPVCLRTCQQQRIIQHCDCYSMELGFVDSEAFAEERRNRGYIPSCFINQAGGDRDCVNQVMNDVADGKLGCKDECYYQKCNHNFYETHVSATAWPALHAFKSIEDKLTGSKIPAIRDYWSHIKALNLSRAEEDRIEISRLFIRQNFVKLQIYLSDLNVVKMKTHACYTFIDMLADLGGNGGLWLGISVFSLFEICIFLVNFCCSLYAPEDDDMPENSRENGKHRTSEDATGNRRDENTIELLATGSKSSR